MLVVAAMPRVEDEVIEALIPTDNSQNSGGVRGGGLGGEVPTEKSMYLDPTGGWNSRNSHHTRIPAPPDLS